MKPERLGRAGSAQAIHGRANNRGFLSRRPARVRAFDQWGVELGKELANKPTPIVADSSRSTADLDSSTAGLIAAARKYGEG